MFLSECFLKNANRQCPMHPLPLCILNRAQNWIPTQMVWQPGVTERKWAILQCVRELNEQDTLLEEARRPLIFCCFLVTLKCLPLSRCPGKVFWELSKWWDGWQSCVECHSAHWDPGLQATSIYSFGALMNQNIIPVTIFSVRLLNMQIIMRHPTHSF